MTNTTDRAKALLREKARRNKLPAAVEQVLESLFPLQAEFEGSKARRKVGKAGRRSGKTFGLGARLFRAAVEHPGSVVPVFERTLTCTAANTLWAELRTIDERYKLEADFHNTYRTATLTNKSVIALLGSDTIEQCDKHRGGKFPVVGVDEAGTYRDHVLEYLLDQVVIPATVDYHGEIIVTGTPSLQTKGTWYNMCHNLGKDGRPLPKAVWEQHHWTLLDNPTIPDHILKGGNSPAERRAFREFMLREILEEKNWTEQTACFLREYMGVWANDMDERVYAVDSDRNLIDHLPVLERGQSWTYWLSMDLGFNDPTAFVVLARRTGDPTLYVVESYEQTELVPSQVAEHVARLQARFTFSGIVADTGGYGKGPAEEMKQTYGIPVEAAQKSGKRAALEHTSGECRTGRIKIVRDSNMPLWEDLLALPWNEDKSDVHERYRDHLPDALLYGARKAAHSLPTRGPGATLGPAAGSREWYELQADAFERRMDMVAEHEAELARRSGADDEDDSWLTDNRGF